MNIIRLCGVAIISVVAAVLVKRVKADFGAFVSIIAAVVIFGAAGKIEFAAKCAIMLLSLPVIKNILSLSEAVLEK